MKGEIKMKELIKIIETAFKKMVSNPIFWLATMMPLICSVILAIVEILETLALIPKGREIGIQYALVGVVFSVFFFFTFL
ncbi:MAG: hypothetical protein KGI39_03340, partial [Patescibacteria group bacterium]|nr:hypothetical protein [Patescibacteria group bacterium]